MKIVTGLAILAAIVLAGPLTRANAAPPNAVAAPVPTTGAPSTVTYDRASFWGKAVKYVGCATGIGAAVLGNTACTE